MMERDLQDALFQATKRAQGNMLRLHKKSENATDKEKQFAKGQFSALYGLILDTDLQEAYRAFEASDNH